MSICIGLGSGEANSIFYFYSARFSGRNGATHVGKTKLGIDGVLRVTKSAPTFVINSLGTRPRRATIRRIFTRRFRSDHVISGGGPRNCRNACYG